MASPVDPLNSIARLAALMRQAAAPEREGVGSGRTSRRGKPLDKSSSVGSAAASLSDQVRAIDRDHPQRRRKAARLLIETLLSDEFGPAVCNDAGFQTVVDQVLETIEDSKALRPDLDQVLDALLGN